MSVLDPAEVDRFDALAEEWWSLDGPMAPLHKMNPVRLGFIRDQVTQHFQLDSAKRKPLTDLRLLDVGAGCGLISEPMARLGADVTAIDPSERNIEVARRHMKEMGLKIEYQPIDTERLLQTEYRPFDIVTCLEVIEHSPAPDILVQDLAELTKPGGLLVMSTLNQTAQSFFKAILGAEYLLGWLPVGTHNWRRFLAPSKLARYLRIAGFRLIQIQGVEYNSVRDDFSYSHDRSVNYLLAAVRI